MTALAEALLAAQRQATNALAKPYIAGTIDAEEVVRRLESFGCTDMVDQGYLLAAWDTIQTYGAPAPTNAAAPPAPKLMSPAQKRRIELDCKDRGWQQPDFEALPTITMDEASQIIDSIKDGSYDAARWNPPF